MSSALYYMILHNIIDGTFCYLKFDNYHWNNFKNDILETAYI